MYSDLYIKPQQRPYPFLSIAAVLVVGLAVGVFFLQNLTTGTRASKKTVERHELANVSSHQVGIFWKSHEPDQGWIIYGSDEQNLNKIVLDERDTSNNRISRGYHYILLKGLQPDTTYYYRIVSNNELISTPNGEPFRFKTTRDYSSVSAPKPAYGKVVLPNGEPAGDTFVFLRYKNSYPLVTLTKSSGEWLIPLQFGVERTTNNIIDILEQDRATLELFNDESKTTVTAVIRKLNPVPQTLILGKDYQFVEQEQVLSASSRVVIIDNKDYPVTLQYPKENAVIPGVRALIKGTGVPGKKVMITINSRPPFQAETYVEKDATWMVTNSSAFTPGSYEVNVITEDKNGRKIGFERKFVLIKSGEQVLAVATGSATITPTTVPTTAPTVAPSPTGTTALPTSVPTSIPIATPTTAYVPQTYVTTVPVAGSNDLPYYVLTGLGFVIIGAGLVLLF
jgi:hypothetical protein